MLTVSRRLLHVCLRKSSCEFVPEYVVSIVLDRRVGQTTVVPAMRLSDESGTPIDPIELYAAAIDISDYAARIAPVIQTCVPAIGDLLDVGAGGGQLGNAVRQPGRRWTTIEPNSNMRA